MRRPPAAVTPGVLAALAVLCALAGGCARAPALSQSVQGRTASPAAATTAPAAPAGHPAPLTGSNEAGSVAGRPAVAVPVSGADPAGLASADLVFEESGSSMRYLAVFQSTDAGLIGPVATTLPSDGQLLSALHPLTGYAGGSAPFIRLLDKTKGIVDEGYARNSSLYAAASQGLTTSTSAFYHAANGDGPPPQLFSYRSPGSSAALATAGLSPARSVRVTMPGLPAQSWTFDSRAGRWTLTSGGPKIQVANLVIQAVRYKQVYLSHRYGTTAPSPVVLGTGPARVFSSGKDGGTSATGSWAKRGIANLTAYLDSSGYPMTFAPGPTWIVLAPPGTRTEG